MKPAIKQERSGWRDEAISRKHREWGWDCPAVDIDFLLLEYDRAIPVALIEYKHENAPVAHSVHPSYRALSILATRANIPFFSVRYASDFSWWLITALNELAKRILPDRVTLDESQYVQFLYQLRDRIVD
jgi:hypothetical protein